MGVLLAMTWFMTFWFVVARLVSSCSDGCSKTGDLIFIGWGVALAALTIWWLTTAYSGNSHARDVLAVSCLVLVVVALKELL